MCLSTSATVPAFVDMVLEVHAVRAKAKARTHCRTVNVTLPPNESRLSCGRNAGWRKAVDRQRKRLAGEATQFFPHARPPASSAC